MPKLLVLAVSLAVLSSPALAEPELLSTVPSKHAINGVEVIDGYAYVADTYALRIIDVHDPSRPRVVWTSPRMRSYADAIRRVGPDTLYMLATPAGSVDAQITIYRIVRPGVVKLAGKLNLPGAITNRFHVRGSTVYVPGGAGGLLVVDASRPLKPRIVATERFGADSVGDLTIDGDRAYAILRTHVGGSSVAIVDLRDATRPRVLGEILAGLGASHVAVHAGIGYVTHGTHDVSIVDLRGDGAPELDRMRLESTHTGFVYTEGGVLLAGSRPLTLFDLSSPASPRSILTVDAGGDSIRDVRQVDDLLFVAGHQFGGLRILSLR